MARNEPLVVVPTCRYVTLPSMVNGGAPPCAVMGVNTTEQPVEKCDLTALVGIAFDVEISALHHRI